MPPLTEQDQCRYLTCGFTEALPGPLVGIKGPAPVTKPEPRVVGGRKCLLGNRLEELIPGFEGNYKLSYQAWLLTEAETKGNILPPLTLKNNLALNLWGDRKLGQTNQT